VSFSDQALGVGRPSSVRWGVRLPRRHQYLPSPTWRDQVIYFLLVDRFSDERTDRPLLDRDNRAAARRPLADGQPWRWDAWAASGAERWQGGTLRGAMMRLPYLVALGVSAIWLSPVFKQRADLDTYHGYGIQDFLDVDPHLGTRRDLVELVAAAHDAGLRVILDVIFNHTGMNWIYPEGVPGGAYTPAYTAGRYDFGDWLGDRGQRIAAIAGPDDGVWPSELQEPDRYTRAGSGSLGAGDIDDPAAEHKRSDFITLRDLALAAPDALADLARCCKYWIALTGCDGFRIDTLKHVTTEQARNFCGSVKEFAANLGVHDFLLLAEVAGGDFAQDRYIDVLARNLNAALDIGEMRPTLTAVAKGLTDPRHYFAGFDPGNAVMGSHRALGDRHVSVLDDHDHVVGSKLRFTSEAAAEHEDHQVVAAVALQLLTLGIPCIYYGTEQALAGPETGERQWLPEWGRSDRYLREALFGPDHPRRSGRDGLAAGAAGLDSTLPGFGPFGTAGHHCFDPTSPAFVRIAALIAVRRSHPVLRHGRQYLRPIAVLGRPFGDHGLGELIAWSRILDDEEALCVVNGHGLEVRGADVVVDAALNGPDSTMTVVLNTAEAAGQAGVNHPAGSSVAVLRAPDGTAFVPLRDLHPAEVLVLTNYPSADDGAVVG
jgi:glycosidase